MSTAPAASSLPPNWARWYRRALPSYWTALFVVTHLPKLHLPRPVPRDSDKLLHFLAFALLAFLFWRFAEAFGRALAARFVWLAAAVLLLYGVLDEYLQQFTGRSAGIDDWAMDALGVGLSLALLEWRRRRASVTPRAEPRP